LERIGLADLNPEVRHLYYREFTMNFKGCNGERMIEANWGTHQPDSISSERVSDLTKRSRK